MLFIGGPDGTGPDGVGIRLDEKAFPEIRARAEAHLERYGIAGRIPEEDLLGLGDRLLGEKKFDKAAEVLEYAVERYSGSVDAWIGLGDALRSLGRLDRARNSYLKAIDLAPGRREAAARLKKLER